MGLNMPRNYFWVDKTTLKEFLQEPINEKLYEVYLNIKRLSPSQDFQTLQLFNEVYYLCTKIIYENASETNLNLYIQEIKADMGWNYPSSIVINMIYAVLSLREGNNGHVNKMINVIKDHYKMSLCKNLFYQFVEEERIHNHSYKIQLLEKQSMVDNVLNIPSMIPFNLLSTDAKQNVQVTINVTNEYKNQIGNLFVDNQGEIHNKK